MIRRSVNGFNPAVLHATLKSLIFIGDFDTSLVKSIEDELMVKIMSRYEAEQTACPRTSTIRSSFEIVDSIVHDIVDDVSDSIEVVNMTEILLGIFKVRSLTLSSILDQISIDLYRLIILFIHIIFVPIL